MCVCAAPEGYGFTSVLSGIGSSIFCRISLEKGNMILKKNIFVALIYLV